MPEKSIFSLVGLSESDGQAGDLQQQEEITLVRRNGKDERLGLGKT